MLENRLKLIINIIIFLDSLFIAFCRIALIHLRGIHSYLRSLRLIACYGLVVQPSISSWLSSL